MWNSTVHLMIRKAGERMEQSVSEALDAFLEAECTSWGVPGMALVMALRGEPAYRCLYGYRDVARRLPVTERTVFGVASVTKSVTALAVMLAQDHGKLSVDDPVVRWLPELQGVREARMRAVTVHHLLTHTAGFPGMAALFRARAESIRKDPDWRITAAEMPDPFEVAPIRDVSGLMAVLKELDFRFLGNPGTVFNYSNEGYALLQEILERATGKSFLEFVQQRIFDPLGIRSAVFRTADLSRMRDVTELYAARAEDGHRIVFHSPVWWDVGDIYSNGSMKIHMADLLRYLEVYRCHGEVDGVRILSEDGWKRMTARHVQTPTGRGYGYGLHVDEHHGVNLLSHSGGIKGVSADVVVAPEAGITVAAAANVAGVPVSQWTLAALNAALGLPLDARVVDYPIQMETAGEDTGLAEYEGLYRSEEGGRAVAETAGGELWITQRGQRTRLYPYAEDGFADATRTLAVRFLRDARGQVWGLFTGVRVLLKSS
ncbi:MAG: beta-lactamase family protein [Alicyclobacillus macrosporangiidus]|uniref:serine hydrolase domain-containing protein n=1 Tax=Alicyclobacillus macrosporangiidus TaxID=392015 RepID=UPI0026F08258|nr:serine hydrolase [Alicyclobacillus macrosporangiidus]MCL6600531.1 beta-lactamase family protein [Alicyclobacillus macrosporangiidus]